MSFHVPEQFRIVRGQMATDKSWGNNGAFLIKLRHSQRVFVIASDGLGWEHVSVSHDSYTPTWEEMCQVKEMFWDPEDCVVQYHPRASEYVDLHRHCLHLWRPTGAELPRPDPILVGPMIRKPAGAVEAPTP